MTKLKPCETGWLLSSQEQFTQKKETGNHTTLTELIILGITEDPTLCIVFFCDISRSIRHHVSRKYQHHYIDKNFFPAAHTHVPVPQSSGFWRHCIFNLSLSYNAYGTSWAWAGPTSGCLWSPALYHSVIWVSEVLHIGCHGLWSLCCHLFTPALLHAHVPQSLFSTAGSFLCWWLHEWLDIYWLFVKSDLLWTKSDRSLFLWLLPFVETLLFRCLCYWYHPLYLFWLHHSGDSVCHSRLLHLHPHHHPEDALHWGPPEGLLHLHLPPHCSHSVLWDHHLHLYDAQVQLLHRPEQGAVCILHSGDPHAEPPHLQSEEQRCKGCSEEGNC